MRQERRSPDWRAGAPELPLGERKFHVEHASADALLQRLEGVQKSGNGWRARCPACNSRDHRLSVTVGEKWVRPHCFGGCDAETVLAAVGLRWADLAPPRAWPASPAERREWSRAQREAGWAAALTVLDLEAAVVLIACQTLARGESLDPDDTDRLARAAERVADARLALAPAQPWRPIRERA